MLEIHSVPSQANRVVLVKVEAMVQASTLQATAAELLRREAASVLLDMSALTFVESSGLGALVSFYKQLNEGNCRLLLFNIQPYVQKLMEITKLNRVLNLYTTQQEAEAALLALS